MYNRIMAIGNLGRDPEMRYTAQGVAMTTFSIATNRVYTDAGGERQEETQWFTVVTWRQLAEQCNQYLTKGRPVPVMHRQGGGLLTCQRRTSRSLRCSRPRLRRAAHRWCSERGYWPEDCCPRAAPGTAPERL